QTLRSLLEADFLAQRESRAAALTALLAALERGGPDVEARVAALEGLGAVGEAARHNPAATAWLAVDRASATFAERAARLRAIAQLELAGQRDAVAAFVEQLPLDAPSETQHAAGHALVRLEPSAALKRLDARLKNKSAAGLEVATELDLLGELPAALVVP